MTTKAEARWTEIVERQRVSGLSNAAFARQEGINEVTLGTWRRRLSPRRSAPPVSFIEVKREDRQPFSVEIRGIRVVVPSGFDPVELRRLVQVLEGRS